MSLPKLVVGITQGDSNGIGYEVIIKSLADERILDSFTPVIYGSSKLMGFYRKTLHNIGPMDINVINSAADAKQKKINLVNCLPDNIYAEPGQSTPDSAKAAIKSLEMAVKDLKEGQVDVLVTAPINKRAMNEEGFCNTGHTEYLQREFGADDVTMIMVSEQIKIGVVTGHIPLRDVPKSLTRESILGKLRIMKDSLLRDFGVTDPKIAVLGLNPHCGDGGLLGDDTAETAGCWETRSRTSSCRPCRRRRPRASRPSVPTPPTASSAWGTTAASTPPWRCTTTRAWPRSRPSLSPTASISPPAFPL